jgi:hypothetical protein
MRQAEFQGCSFVPADRQADGRFSAIPDLPIFLEQGIPMKKFALAAALLAISASAHAGTYTYQGVTFRVQEGCRSSSCVSVNAPGYGSYHGGHQLKLRKVHKDTSRFASAKKEEAAPAPAMEATPATTPDAAPAK